MSQMTAPSVVAPHEKDIVCTWLLTSLRQHYCFVLFVYDDGSRLDTAAAHGRIQVRARDRQKGALRVSAFYRSYTNSISTTTNVMSIALAAGVASLPLILPTPPPHIADYIPRETYTPKNKGALRVVSAVFPQLRLAQPRTKTSHFQLQQQ